MHYTYFLLNILTIAGPLALSFDKKVAFWRQWKYAGLGIAFASVAFLLWDVVFTRIGVWRFNTNYTTGLHIYNLPWEEVFFFVSIPYACLFIYECLRVYFPGTDRKLPGRLFGWVVVLFCAASVFLYYDKLYTSVTAILLLITFLNHLLVTKGDYLNHLMFTWLVALIPMVVIDGLLTGLPVLIYDDAQNTGIRTGPIPIEDYFYNLLYLTWMIWVYERYKQRPYWKEKEQEEKLVRKSVGGR